MPQQGADLGLSSSQPLRTHRQSPAHHSDSQDGGHMRVQDSQQSRDSTRKTSSARPHLLMVPHTHWDRDRQCQAPPAHGPIHTGTGAGSHWPSTFSENQERKAGAVPAVMGERHCQAACPAPTGVKGDVVRRQDLGQGFLQQRRGIRDRG